MHTMLFSHVLVPYDGSELSIKSLDKAIEFAQLNPNMKITVLHIVSIPPRTVQMSLYNQYKQSILDEANEIILKLIEQNYLNEERFARSFAGGKFRIKKWGRIKIKTELKNKQISNYCITEAMDEIDDHKYKETLHKLAVKRWNSIKGEGTNLYVKMTKTRDHLLLKGYESILIAIEIKSLAEKQKGAG